MLEEHWTIKNLTGASLMVQWLKTCLLTQGAQVQNLVWEDPTCQGASLCTTTTGAHELQPLKPESPPAYVPQEKPPSPCTTTREQALLSTSTESPHPEPKTQRSQK